MVTDADMAYPTDWRSVRGGRKAADAGHQEGGKTVGIHSLAVLPRLHRCGIGQMLVKAYLDQMRNSGLVERVALICQDVSALLEGEWRGGCESKWCADSGVVASRLVL